MYRLNKPDPQSDSRPNCTPTLTAHETPLMHFPPTAAQPPVLLADSDKVPTTAKPPVLLRAPTSCWSPPCWAAAPSQAPCACGPAPQAGGCTAAQPLLSCWRQLQRPPCHSLGTCRPSRALQSLCCCTAAAAAPPARWCRCCWDRTSLEPLCRQHLGHHCCAGAAVGKSGCCCVGAGLAGRGSLSAVAVRPPAALRPLYQVAAAAGGGAGAIRALLLHAACLLLMERLTVAVLTAPVAAAAAGAAG